MKSAQFDEHKKGVEDVLKDINSLYKKRDLKTITKII